jgi:hypothetical protein
MVDFRTLECLSKYYFERKINYIFKRDILKIYTWQIMKIVNLEFEEFMRYYNPLILLVCRNKRLNCYFALKALNEK